MHDSGHGIFLTITFIKKIGGCFKNGALLLVGGLLQDLRVEDYPSR